MRVAWILAFAAAAAIVALGSVLASAAMPDAVRIPIAQPHPEGAPKPAALFRHSTHAQYGCYGCHPAIFPQYPLGFTHQDMQDGRFCASCHDGRGAFAIATAKCERCHVP